MLELVADRVGGRPVLTGTRSRALLQGERHEGVHDLGEAGAGPVRPLWIQQVRAEVDNFQKDYDERLAKLGQQRDAALAELALIEPQLPHDIGAKKDRGSSNRR